MKPILQYLSLACLLAFPSLAQDSDPHIGLKPEMDRLKIDTVLITKTRGLDEWVIWSKDGRHVAVNAMGNWIKFDLSKVELIDAKWRGGKPLGVNIGKTSVAFASDSEIHDWLKTSKMYPRELTLPSGVKIELRQIELSTALVITAKGAEPKTIWVTGGENCHSLTASPTGEYFAFISEMNGAVIMRAPN